MTSESEIRARIEESRKELLDLSLRNPLLNWRPLTARGVEIVGENAAQVFTKLVGDRRSMTFLPAVDDEVSNAYPLWEDTLELVFSADQMDNRLQTTETSANLQKRLLNTYRLANTSIQETGVNTLFLGLGMLKWYESDFSQEERKAPLVLVPVRLERTSVRARFRLEYTGDDLGTNLSLLEKVREDFALELPGADVLEPEDGQDIDVADYISQVEDAVRRSALSRWTVDPDRIVLGFFSFNKLLMYMDLGRSSVVNNETVTTLFGDDGFSDARSNVGDGESLDDRLSPSDVFHVLDADSSQALAIHDATQGRNMVIQGPPGTGKSQTITNIIAEAVAQGKRTLFVSEKMAALEVVKRRLDSIGLGNACLELHSHKTNKRETLKELDRILNSSVQITSSLSEDLLGQLSRTRNQLNEYAESVNAEVGNSGVTPYDAFGSLLALEYHKAANPISRSEVPEIVDWSGADFQHKREVVEDLRLRLQNTGIPNQHPFWGSRLRLLLPDTRTELRSKIETALRRLTELTTACKDSADAIRFVCPEDISAAHELLAASQRAVNAAAGAPAADGLDLYAPQWKSHGDRVQQLLSKGLCWRHIHAEYDSLLLPHAWDGDFQQVRFALNTGGRNFLKRLLSSDYKRAKAQLAAVMRGQLPSGTDRQVALIDAISEEQQLRAEINEQFADVVPAIGRQWNGLNTDWEAIAPEIRWWLAVLADASEGNLSGGVVGLLRDFTSETDKGGVFKEWQRKIEAMRGALDDYSDAVRELQLALDMDNRMRFGNPDGLTPLPFSEQCKLLRKWNANLERVQEIAAFNAGSETASEQGLQGVVAIAAKNPMAAMSLTSWFERAWYESIVETALSERPALRRFDGNLHEGRIERFKSLDRQSLEYNRERVALAHRRTAFEHEQLPDRLVRRGSGPDADQIRERQQQLRILRREIQKKARHKPIRRLLDEAGQIVQELKPIFMMSPLSIANYLDPDSVAFDLVVFDEASQVRPVDALGALLRAEKAVVVGDDKQLPPSRFFDRVAQANDDDDDDVSVTADIESILGLFASKGAPNRNLRWHYRSRHESLIAVSNQEFYDNGLVVFPSPDAGREATGLRFHHLPGAIYDRGRSAVNRQEADAVASAVMEHAAKCPDLSLGVAAFSQSQAQAIEDRLEVLRIQDDSGEEFFAAHTEEPFFVKNLENVQGDERDVIFISIGYGRDATGQVSMNFGPLNNQGGERRLNVLITRAKHQCHVFSNLKAADIESSRTRSAGVRALKMFLEYAETGDMPKDDPHESDFSVDSPFQREVARRLKSLGYEVHEEVASGGKFVDIGIVDPKHPGRYVIGIEFDGATYHSSRSARDRDRLREQVLKGLGWTLHHIWSSDWYSRPELQLKRTVDAIEHALRSSRT